MWQLQWAYMATVLVILDAIKMLQKCCDNTVAAALLPLLLMLLNAKQGQDVYLVRQLLSSFLKSKYCWQPSILQIWLTSVLNTLISMQIWLLTLIDCYKLFYCCCYMYCSFILVLVWFAVPSAVYLFVVLFFRVDLSRSPQYICHLYRDLKK